MAQESVVSAGMAVGRHLEVQVHGVDSWSVGVPESYVACHVRTAYERERIVWKYTFGRV